MSGNLECAIQTLYKLYASEHGKETTTFSCSTCGQEGKASVLAGTHVKISLTSNTVRDSQCENPQFQAGASITVDSQVTAVRH